MFCLLIVLLKTLTSGTRAKHENIADFRGRLLQGYEYTLHNKYSA
jgi:hypothetical protein